MPTSPLPVESPSLPTPGERPESCVVIFDGNCRFCRAQVARLARWDSRRALSFLPLQDPQVAEKFPDLSHDQLMQQMYLIDRDGGRHGGAAAFRYMTRLLPRLWILAPLLHIPYMLPIWQWCYRQVAARRYRLASDRACDSGSCDVHFR